jgi:hypothetical protein
MSDSNGSTTDNLELDEEFARSLAEAPLQAQLRFHHSEKWVAWAPDEQSIIASGDDFSEVREAARQAGFPRAVMEWIDPPYRRQ